MLFHEIGHRSPVFTFIFLPQSLVNKVNIKVIHTCKMVYILYRSGPRIHIWFLYPPIISSHDSNLIIFHFGNIQYNNIHLNYSRTNLQAPSTFLFHMLFNCFGFFGFTTHSSMYYSYQITIAQWFYPFVLPPFSVAHLFSFITYFLSL